MKRRITQTLALLLGISVFASACGRNTQNTTTTSAETKQTETTATVKATQTGDKNTSKKSANILMNPTESKSSQQTTKGNQTTQNNQTTKPNPTTKASSQVKTTTQVTTKTTTKPTSPPTTQASTQATQPPVNPSSFTPAPVEHGALVENGEKHLFWRNDPDPMTKGIAEILYQGLLEGKTEIDVAPAFGDKTFTKEPGDIVSKVFWSVKDTDPRFFYYYQKVSLYYYYDKTSSGDMKITRYLVNLEIRPEYQDLAARQAALADLNNKAWAAADWVSGQSNDLVDRLLIAHDWLARTAFYSPTSDRLTNNPLSAFTAANETMCVGYALAYQMLVNRIGGEAISVYGFAQAEGTKGEEHNWNLVKLGDHWYFVDVTWDDTGDQGDSKKPSMATPSFNYFLRAANQVKDHTIYSFGVPDAPQDFQGNWPVARNEEDIKNLMVDLFKQGKPTADVTPTLRASLDFDISGLTIAKLDEIINAAYNEAGADYRVLWYRKTTFNRLWIALYPG